MKGTDGSQQLFKYIYFYYRSQTTKGVWIAKCIGIEPFTIVMDLEGTDGRDRGEVMHIKITFLFFCLIY